MVYLWKGFGYIGQILWYFNIILYFLTVLDHSLKNIWQEITKDNIIALQLGQELYSKYKNW